MKRALLTLLFAGTLHAASSPAWVHAVTAQPEPPQVAGTAAVVLSDSTLLTVAPSGEVTTLRRRVVKVLTAAGRDHAYGFVAFDDNTKLRSLEAWSIDPSGKVRNVRERDAVETSAASFEVFTDTRMKFLDIPSEVGSVVAYEYETRERPYEPGSVWRFQEEVPVLQARLEVRLPEGWSVEDHWFNYARTEPAGRAVWELRNVPALIDEPEMPAARALAGWMGVQWNGSRTWRDVGAWFNGLAAERLMATAALQTKSRELTAGASDPIRALARFAQRDVRYVAVEIGIGGYQPHPAGEIFANRYGDCKDKATLLRSMLKQIGVDARYVVVNTTRGMVEPSFATIASFNHVITAIPITKERAAGLGAVIDHPTLGRLLIFDPTSTTTPYGELPPSLQASRGLLITDGGGELIDLPGHAPEASALRRTARLALDEDGTLHGTVEETRTGDMAARMRAELQALNVAGRVQFIEETLASHLASQTAADVKVEHLDEPEADLVIRYSLVSRGYAKRVADMILVRPRVLGAKGGVAVATADRKQGYVTEGPSLQTDEVEITVPATLKLDELPHGVELTTPHVRYTSASSFDKGVLRYRRNYAMKVYAVERDAIPALNAAFAKIGADERASAVFK